jgi:hypothetical protein
VTLTAYLDYSGLPEAVKDTTLARGRAPYWPYLVDCVLTDVGSESGPIRANHSKKQPAKKIRRRASQRDLPGGGYPEQQSAARRRTTHPD